MTDPWQDFEAALQGPSSDRVSGLRRVLAGLETAHDYDLADRLELEACAKAELATLGQIDFGEALAAVQTAASNGRAGWPNYYLAFAADASERWTDLLRIVEGIPPGYFVDMDMTWRAALVDELQAMALIRLGRWDDAGTAIGGLVETHLAAADDEFLVAPTGLLRLLGERLGVALEMFTSVAELVDIDKLPDREPLNQIREAARALRVEGV